MFLEVGRLRNGASLVDAGSKRLAKYPPIAHDFGAFSCKDAEEIDLGLTCPSQPSLQLFASADKQSAIN